MDAIGTYIEPDNSCFFLTFLLPLYLPIYVWVKFVLVIKYLFYSTHSTHWQLFETQFRNSKSFMMHISGGQNWLEILFTSILYCLSWKKPPWLKYQIFKCWVDCHMRFTTYITVLLKQFPTLQKRHIQTPEVINKHVFFNIFVGNHCLSMFVRSYSNEQLQK